MTTDEDPLAVSIAAMVGRLQDQPKRLEAVLNGFALDGTFARLGIPAGLAPFMRLPPPEPRRQVRARMAELMARRMSADGNYTREDLLAGGFTPAEIDRHHRDAQRIARVERMVA